MWGFNFDIIYIFLNLFLLTTFYVAGKNIQRGDGYWKNAWVCIVSFTLILGARYNRGNDYPHYLEVFKYDLESSQEVYSFLCNLMKTCGVNEYGSFFVYAFVFSVCLFVLLKRYKQYAMYIFPMSLVFMIYFHEFMIRQAFSYSFVFLYINSLFNVNVKDKSLKSLFRRDNFSAGLRCLIFYFLATGIHSANIIVIFVVTILYIFVHSSIPVITSIPLLIFSTYFFSKLFDFSSLSIVLEYLGGADDKFTNYANHAYIWFDSDGFNDIYVRNPIIGLLELLGHISLFYLGAKVINKYEKAPSSYALYNCYVFGVIFQSAFLQLELMNRMGYVFKIWQFYPIALILYYRKKLELKSIDKAAYLFIIFLFYDYLKNLIYRAEMTKFLWDM